MSATPNKSTAPLTTCSNTSLFFKKQQLLIGLRVAAAAAAKSLQSCPTLCSPIDGSPPGSPVPGILQARAPEWIAISFSNAWKWKVKVKLLSHVQLLATPWTAAYQAPPSMGFSRQEYWSGVSWPSLGLPIYNSKIKQSLKGILTSVRIKSLGSIKKKKKAALQKFKSPT